MSNVIQPFHLLVIALAGWLNRHQKDVIDYLNRRGGKRRSFNWAEFRAALTKLNIALPRIVEKPRQHVVFA